jgi:hypothetical protein
MARGNPDRTRRYLELITQGKGGLESVIEDLKGLP